MRIQAFENSYFSSVTYLIDDCTLIDPGDYRSDFKRVNTVLLTHVHFDHIYGLNELLSHKKDILVFTNLEGREMLLNAKLNLSWYHESPFVFSNANNVCIVKDNDEILLSNGLAVKAVFTPGHNHSCVTWMTDDMLFTGDSYIPGIKTITNLPGGNRKQAEESLRLIHQLAIGRSVYPGHKVNLK
ncbi:MAG: MBL fold metallo-hydrolase [Bacteroides sp.]|nr:MBL fold metallo-hydrolase [Bacteroides sp.]